MELYGQNWRRRELEARVGRLEQIGGVKRLILQEGPESGTEQIHIRTGAGLAYYVTPSRGMDIGLAEYAGTPVSWQAPNGDIHPAYYDSRGTGWLRTAAGGLLMTCGLMQAGAPGEDGGEELGLHGRIHHTPARQVRASGEWQGDQYEMTVSGIMEEVSIFGGHLRLTRVIRSTLGRNGIRIQDMVENIGFVPCPHMMLYHFNFGFPLMGPETTIVFSGEGRTIEPREPELPVEGFNRWQAPVAGFRERVYYHHIPSSEASVTISNPGFPAGPVRIPLRAVLQWRTDTLPLLVQWYMSGEGTHVLGMEPSNCRVGGRKVEREQGSLTILEPGESRSYDLQLTLEGA